jgi:hypothetical protein
MMIGGSLAALLAIALLFAAGTLLYFDTQRDSAGYVSTDMTSYSTGTFAIVSDSYRAGRAGDLFVPKDIRVSARLGGEPAAAVSGWAGISRLENFSVVAQNAGDPQPPWRQGAGCSKVSDSPRRATCGSAPHSSACCDCQAPASSMSRSASGAWS